MTSRIDRMSKLDQLRGLLSRCTKGPWVVVMHDEEGADPSLGNDCTGIMICEESDEPAGSAGASFIEGSFVNGPKEENPYTAMLITEARNTLPALLDLVQAQHEALKIAKEHMRIEDMILPAQGIADEAIEEAIRKYEEFQNG